MVGGKYRLLERLGVGGMGEVYRASNDTIGRLVAIKLLRPEHASTPETSERLAREARAANLVRHANVVDVLDHGVDERLGVYLVQELLEGEDLSAHLVARGGSLPADEAFGIFGSIVEAVAAAHASGVVHRDLKPANIFLARQVDGRVVPKVLDFGISKISGLTGRIDISTLAVTMGTPAYMSPEQIQGEPVDARSDVWSLGVILHQIISGELPFRGDSPGKQYVKICTEPPTPLDEAAPGAPASLVALVARCLQREVADRYQNAGEVAASVRQIAASSLSGSDANVEPAERDAGSPYARGELPSTQILSPVARRSESPRASRRAAYTGTIGLLVIAGGLILLLRQGGHGTARAADRTAATARLPSMHPTGLVASDPSTPTDNSPQATISAVTDAGPVAEPTPIVAPLSPSPSPSAGAAITRRAPVANPVVRGARAPNGAVRHPGAGAPQWGVITEY